MDIKTQLKSLVGRDVATTPAKIQGKQGFIPEYFNYTDRNFASKLFSETEEGALENLLLHLQEKDSGGSHGTNTTSQQ